MLKTLVFVLALAGHLLADDLRFTLPCQADDPKDGFPKKVSHVSVVKVAKKVAKPKKGEKAWENSYFVRVEYKNKELRPKEIPLEAEGGDEDYLEYSLKATDKEQEELNIQGGQIQVQFKWAKLVDFEGYNFASCEPEEKAKK